MTGLLIAIVTEVLFLLWLSFCIKALRRSWKTKVAVLPFGTFERASKPIRYWSLLFALVANVAVYLGAMAIVALLWLATLN